LTEHIHASAAASRPADEGFGDSERLVGSFDEACRASGGVHEREFELAGSLVRLRSANAEMMQRLSKAFTHLEAKVVSREPDLTINLWDSETDRTPPPPLPNTRDEEAPGAFFYHSDDRLRIGFQLGTSGDARVLAVYPEAPTPALSVLERDGDRAWYWVADATRIPYWEQATPMVYLLDWWLRDRGLHMLHAGAVGTPEGGVILVGKSGSGKSTATLTSLQAGSGLLYAGDDYVGVSLEAEPRVHGLYSSGKLMPDHVQRLPFLLEALVNSDQLDVEKAVVYVHEQWPARMSSGFPLRAILAPRVVPGLVEARLVETSSVAGFTALAPSTVFQMHTRGQDSLMRVRRLVETVPSYVLELGSDMLSIPHAISDLLTRLGGEE
jgi:hypothetical protein